VLDDSDVDVAEAAAASLSELKEHAMATPLLAAFSQQTTPATQTALLRALRELRAPGAFEPALAALKSEHSTVRCAGIGVLGYLRNVAALPEIAQIAANDPDPEARRTATGALGFASDTTSVSLTLMTALRDAYWQVREEAAATLGKLKAIEALGHEISNLRKEAAIALGEVGDKGAIPALEAALQDVDPDVRKLAQLALNQILK